MIELIGIWDYGFSLGEHIVKNDNIWIRTTLGNHLSKLKRFNDQDSLKYINNLVIKSFVKSQIHIDEFDYIISVPQSLNSPYFDAASMVTDFISNNYNITYIENFFIRIQLGQIKTINSQSKRQEFVNTAFIFNKNIDGNLFQNKKIILVDDIYDTGSTLNVLCSKIKYQFPNCIILCFTISKTTTFIYK